MADDSGSESGFKINKAYAEKYNKWRQKEELQKLKDKYGDIQEESSSSSEDEDEDENAEALTDRVEQDWLRTLSALKSKDPKIYKKETTFYRNDIVPSNDAKKVKIKTEKPVYLPDYERKVILEKGGYVSESESESEETVASVGKTGYYEEQEEIKESFKRFLDNSDEEDDSGLFQKRKRTKEEKEYEESDYIQWLKGQKTKLTERKAGIELEPLKDFWLDPKLDADEKFLRDYILNKKYLEKDDDRIPTYDEIVDGEGFSEEESLLEKQEDFERKYNFRYEEPDPEFIKSYPRTIETSVRRKESKRAKKREEVKERKKHEKERKKEEIKHMKNLKKQEILDKIKTIKEITGNSSIGFTEDDLEGDFDPDKHNEMMQKYFDNDYYGDEVDETKPEYMGEVEDLQVENWDNWQGDDYEEFSGQNEPHIDDPNFNMDADYDPTQHQPSTKKKKKRSKFYETLTKKKPVFDPKEKTFDEYLDEFYKLDYEDIIGDMPCRFKYRKVVPNSYGLSVDEIIKCRDKELNAWVSLKKMSQYRTTEEETRDVQIYTSKARNEKKKKNILTSLKGKKEDVDDHTEKQTSPEYSSHSKMKDMKEHINKKQKRLKSDNKMTGNSESNLYTSEHEKISPPVDDDLKKKISDTPSSASSSVEKRKRKKKDRSGNDGNKTQEVSDFAAAYKSGTSRDKAGEKNELKKRKKKKQKPRISDERLQAYGINPKKFKYMKFGGKKL